MLTTHIKTPAFSQLSALARFLLKTMGNHPKLTPASAVDVYRRFGWKKDISESPTDVDGMKVSRFINFLFSGDIRYMSQDMLEDIEEILEDIDDHSDDDDDDEADPEKSLHAIFGNHVLMAARVLLLNDLYDENAELFKQTTGVQVRQLPALLKGRYVLDEGRFANVCKAFRADEYRHNTLQAGKYAYPDGTVAPVSFDDKGFHFGSYEKEHSKKEPAKKAAPEKGLSATSLKVAQTTAAIQENRYKQQRENLFDEFNDRSSEKEYDPKIQLTSTRVSNELTLTLGENEDPILITLSTTGKYVTGRETFKTAALLMDHLEFHFIPLGIDEPVMKKARPSKLDRSSLVAETLAQKQKGEPALANSSPVEDADDDEFVMPTKGKKKVHPFTKWQQERNPRLLSLYCELEEENEDDLMEIVDACLFTPVARAIMELWPAGLGFSIEETDGDYYFCLYSDFISIRAGNSSVEVTRHMGKTDELVLRKHLEMGTTVEKCFAYASNYFGCMSGPDLYERLQKAGYWWTEGLRSVRGSIDVDTTWNENTRNFYSPDTEEELTQISSESSEFASAGDWINSLDFHLYELRGATLEENRLTSMGTASTAAYTEIVLTTPDIVLRGIVQRRTRIDGEYVVEVQTMQGISGFVPETEESDTALLRLCGAVVEETATYHKVSFFTDGQKYVFTVCK